MMKTFQILILLVAGLSVSAHSVGHRSLPQFWRIIGCVMPKNWPIWDLLDYGCFCGYGGSGRPVDAIDRCCQVHDKCYGDAEKYPECNPYFDSYRYKCKKKSKKITCGPKNNKCGQFICECDRKAAECFAKSRLNPKHKDLDQSRCQ